MQAGRRQRAAAVLAKRLTKVYEDYGQYQYNAALNAGKAPLIKKSELSSSGPASASASELPPILVLSRNVIQATASVHKRAANPHYYEIAAPYIPDDMTSINDESDTEGSSSPDESPEEQAMKGKALILTRQICVKCFNPRIMPPSLPDYICWKDLNSVRDDCPKCHKVLYKKPSPWELLKDTCPS